jgi:hypothetical protein
MKVKSDHCRLFYKKFLKDKQKIKVQPRRHREMKIMQTQSEEAMN